MRKNSRMHISAEVIATIVVIAIIAIPVLATMLYKSVAGNRVFIDTTYKYESAIVRLPDDTIIEGPVTKWSDYEDGDQIQVEIEGVTYLVHASNIVLKTK